jgi:uncharacterized protein YndB with AHSA1/START domain
MVASYATDGCKKGDDVATDRIEREILIAAPPSVVWDVLTDPEKVAQWWATAADFEPRPGAEGRLVMTSRATSLPMTVLIRVVQVDPERRFSFRWDYPPRTQPLPATAPLVEFTLVPAGAGTRLRLVESGIDDLDRPEAERDRYYQSHVAGWEFHLPHLRDYAEQLVASGR